MRRRLLTLWAAARPRAGLVLRAALRWSAANAGNLLATLALLLLAYGFRLAWPPLGYIVPGALIFGCLALGRLSGRS